MIFVGMTFISKDAVIALWIRLAVCLAFVAFAVAIWATEESPKSGDAPKKKLAKEGFDWSMHYFRAFAILTIVLMHYYSTFGYWKIVSILFHSSTIFFLFISGYLCKYIDQRHHVPACVYYQKKLINVIAPFIIFSLFFGFMRGKDLLSLTFLKELALGKIQEQYWYIPFVSILFLISPMVCRLNNHNLILVWMVSFFFFLIFPIRPSGFCLDWPNTLYLYSYFTVFYFTGFIYCVYKDSINAAIRKYWSLFASGVLLTTLVLWIGSALKLSIVGYDLLIGIQKFLTILLAIYCLGYLKDKRLLVLDLLAKYSFTLYFIHFGLFARSSTFHDYLMRVIPFPLIIGETVVFSIYVGGILAVCILFKFVLGKYSRPLLGT